MWRLQVAEMAVRDLEKYAKALDAAIMAFHGEKMQEINDTIQDLWQKVYQGTGACVGVCVVSARVSG